MWTGKKSSLNQFHIWGCPTEARPYKPNEKILDSRTISCYFVGYSERSRGFKLYHPKAKSFFEMISARFLEDVDFVEGDTVRNIVFEEENIIIPPDVIGIESIPTSDITYDAILNNVDGEPPGEQTLTPQEVVPLRRSTRERRKKCIAR